MKPLTGIKGMNLSAAISVAIMWRGHDWGIDNMVYIPYNKKRRSCAEYIERMRENENSESV